MIGGMDILSGRVLLRSPDPSRARQFYSEVLGLAVYREYGPPDALGTVFFMGQCLLEVPGHASPAAEPSTVLWMQVRDVAAEFHRLTAAGVRIHREPVLEPWGLVEMWLADPDGVQIVLVQVPEDHPLRRDQR
jgi:catechol 2,3-dioxygenase-like lactoylglutathione lyase family enzyme